LAVKNFKAIKLEMSGNAMKYCKYAINIFLSFLYDIVYLFEQLKNRATIDSYAKFRIQKLYPDYLKQGAMLEGVRYLAMKYCIGKGLDIGAGQWPFNKSRPIEEKRKENAYCLNEPDESIDYIFSSHLLEHLDKPEQAIQEWARVLIPGGVLFMYLPHPSCLMWKKEHLSFHIWNPDPYLYGKFFYNHESFDLEYITYTPDAFFSFVIIVKKKSKT